MTERDSPDDGGVHCREADEWLIATAPELLASCRSLLNVLTEPGLMPRAKWAEWRRRVCVDAVDAIAKATRAGSCPTAGQNCD